MNLFPWRKKRSLEYQTAVIHEVGMRERQEDSVSLVDLQSSESRKQRRILAVVADGMGGMQGGKLASDTVTSCLSHSFSQSSSVIEPMVWLKSQMFQANKQVYRLLNGLGGSTAVCCLIQQDKLWFACVGDSFLYLLRKDELSRLNQLHTVLQREYMSEIQAGGVDPLQARQHQEAEALTSFLGMPDIDAIDMLLAPFSLMDGDILLLCSDGVGDVLKEAEIQWCMQRGNAQAVAEALHQKIICKSNLYQDNFTALVIQCTKP